MIGVSCVVFVVASCEPPHAGGSQQEEGTAGAKYHHFQLPAHMLVWRMVYSVTGVHGGYLRLLLALVLMWW